MSEETKKERPNEEECLRLLRNYGTPEHVIRHCLAVAKAAEILADDLNKNGYALDVDLIRFAACLHDIARVHSRHAAVGAEYLRSLGYEEAADLIEPHMIYAPENPEHVRELDVLCLADRMVKEDRYIGLEKRMTEILGRNRENPEVYGKIQGKIYQTLKQRNFIQNVIGCSMDCLLLDKIP